MNVLIEPRLGAGARDDLIAWGGLHLQSGLAASRSGRRALADDHLAEARETVIPDGSPSERVGHHYIDLSRAYLLHGDRRRAFDALLSAKRISPAQTRYNPMVHETTRAIARAEARAVDSVHGYAV
ncbi:hypothetical protein ACWF9G_06895 [Nocardia sp. NPDC055029]